MVSTALALSLSQAGNRVGLFDLDFTGPSTHIILGVPPDVQPKEEKGLVPASVNGLEYMSLVYFVRDNPAPLRGADVSNALIEILAITQWGQLDFLIIDMPPGIGDPVLDLIRLVKGIEFLIVTTTSNLAFEVVKKQVALLCDLKMPIIGLVENMKLNTSVDIAEKTGKLGLDYLGSIPFDPEIENAIGNPTKLLSSALGKAMVTLGKTLTKKESK
jgi:ATP-binding protein involved in chromosome partitioning